MNAGERHLGDAISALLDGELSPVDEAAAEQHLGACEACRAEYHAIADVRTALRTAPSVEPRRPITLTDELARRASARRASAQRRRPRSMLTGASVAATAACWLLLLAITAGDARVTPPVDDVVGQASVLGGAQTQPGLVQAALSFPTTPTVNSAGYQLASVSVDPSGSGLVFVIWGPEGPVVVHEQAGRADWDALSGAEPVTFGNGEAVQMERGSQRVVVFERDGVVVTIAGNETAARLLRVSDEVSGLGPGSGLGPSGGRRSALDRLRSACRGLVDAFGFALP